MFTGRDTDHGGIAFLTIASIAMTIPFIYYAKETAHSLRKIADKMENERTYQ